MENEKHERLRFALLKKRNKRIEIMVLKEVETGDVSITVYTKRLIGSWKDRNIYTSGVCYGFETFSALSDIFAMLCGDPLFLKTTNRELGQVLKDKMTCRTNIGSGKTK